MTWCWWRRSPDTSAWRAPGATACPRRPTGRRRWRASAWSTEVDLLDDRGGVGELPRRRGIRFCARSGSRRTSLHAGRFSRPIGGWWETRGDRRGWVSRCSRSSSSRRHGFLGVPVRCRRRRWSMSPPRWESSRINSEPMTSQGGRSSTIGLRSAGSSASARRPAPTRTGSPAGRGGVSGRARRGAGSGGAYG